MLSVKRSFILFIILQYTLRVNGDATTLSFLRRVARQGETSNFVNPGDMTKTTKPQQITSASVNDPAGIAQGTSSGSGSGAAQPTPAGDETTTKKPLKATLKIEEPDSTTLDLQEFYHTDKTWDITQTTDDIEETTTDNLFTIEEPISTPRPIIRVKDYRDQKGFTLFQTLNFINELVAIHLMTDNRLNQAIVVTTSRKHRKFIRMLKHHPAYITLNNLLKEAGVGNLQFFDVLQFKEYQPKRSNVKPTYRSLMKRLFVYLKNPDVMQRIRSDFWQTQYYLKLNDPILKAKLFPAMAKVLNLRITSQVMILLDSLGFWMKDIIDYILYVIGYADTFEMSHKLGRSLQQLHQISTYPQSSTKKWK
ncbi:hypothetical protein Trydic_g23539 [Trypoxylus dichotomus]